MQIVHSSTRETDYACQNSLYSHVSEISDVIGATLTFYEIGSAEKKLSWEITLHFYPLQIVMRKIMPDKFHCIFMYQTNLIFIRVALTFMAFGFGTKETQKNNNK